MHDLPTRLDRTLAPGQTLVVRVVFDPAAHGLRSGGRVMHTVSLHTDDGGVRLSITADVIDS